MADPVYGEQLDNPVALGRGAVLRYSPSTIVMPTISGLVDPAVFDDWLRSSYQSQDVRYVGLSHDDQIVQATLRTTASQTSAEEYINVRRTTAVSLSVFHYRYADRNMTDDSGAPVSVERFPYWMTQRLADQDRICLMFLEDDQQVTSGFVGNFSIASAEKTEELRGFQQWTFSLLVNGYFEVKTDFDTAPVAP